MPTRVFRRTPESEKAAVYSYKDLLKDSISLLNQRAGENVERMTSGGGMSTEELAEIALAPAGGMLKVAGTSKLLAGLLAKQAQAIKTGTLQRSRAVVQPEVLKAYEGARGVFKEALKVPEKEYGRIRDIGWESSVLGNKGSYTPRTKAIELNPNTANSATVWHEFTHARQWSPEKGERAFSSVLRFLNRELARKKGLSGFSDFDFNVSPIEKHARNVGRVMTEGSGVRKFNLIYKDLLEVALAEGEMRAGSKVTKDSWNRILQIMRNE